MPPFSKLSNANPLWVKTLIDLCPCIIAKSHLELLGQFHERDAGFEKLLAKAVLNEHSPLKLSVLSFNSRRILHVRLVGTSPGSF